MSAEVIVTYRDGDLSGECLAEWAQRAAPLLRSIPWDTLKHQPDSRYRLIKSSHTRRVISFSVTNTQGATEIVFAKRCRVRSLRKRIAHLFIASKAKREWRMGRLFLARGIPTAAALLFAERRRAGFLDASFIVTRHCGRSVLRPYVSVHEALKQIPYTRQKQLIVALAQFVRTLHNQGVYHDDCTTQHIFVSGNLLANEPPQFSIIDLDNARLLPYVSLYKRLKNILQIMRSLPESQNPQRAKVALFDAYFAGTADRRRKRRLIKLLNLVAWSKRQEMPIRRK